MSGTQIRLLLIRVYTVCHILQLPNYAEVMTNQSSAFGWKFKLRTIFHDLVVSGIHWLILSLTHTHWHMSLAHSLSHYCSFMKPRCTRSNSLTHSPLTHSLSLFHSPHLHPNPNQPHPTQLSLTHLLTHSLSLSHSLTYSLTHSLSLSHSPLLTHTVSLSLSHSLLTHSQKYSRQWAQAHK